MFKNAALAIIVSLSFSGAFAFGQGRGIPNLTARQTAELTRMATDLALPAQAVTAARTALTAAAFAQPRSDATIQAKAEAVRSAELALANARADAFGRLQISANKLAPDQIAAFLGMGGSFAGVAFTQPEPLNFHDNEGYIPLFDGVS